MIRVRKADARGHVEHGWLHSHHTFSFADYYDSAHMGFSVLRVINDDTVEPGKGFGTHPHRDMEIISYVLEGELEHRDSMGHGSVIRPGDVQRMSAGTGVTHSEFNPSSSQRTRFLQIWIIPDRQGLAPGYAQQTFPDALLSNHFLCVASGDGRDGSITIHQDAQIYLGKLHASKASFTVAEGRCAYVHLAKGSARMSGNSLQGGDGAYIDSSTELNFDQANDAEVLLFDLPIREK